MTKFCPFCGEELVDDAKFCKNCGKDVSSYTAQGTGNFTPVQTSEKSHTLAIVAGYILALLIPLGGIIIGIYLITRDESQAKFHAKLIIALAVVVWFISFMIMW
ncbi:MAG: zinc ribbon domain-containing protein [Methanobrevibacter sp.]|jgi:uncharacterized membrane protein YvbJ|uniref:zinc ribbon domain-containing protein n=1 Tax=Methanobrevibacter sp. TaxID=66852 RepID=UPI0025ED9BB5|nr:zinc ribbon domain-containing protein [Methanobrevibacter sp.]MBE6498513.1 zinc ribbon domain-containing protein [Methanobrevibacter sp.]